MGLLAALKERGLRVTPFKVGPDFIDPGHHTRITGQTSRNLDGWMLSKEWNRRTFAAAVHGGAVDVAVVEGVMGLYDGYDGLSEEGSTAQMAKWLGLPVVLVVNAKSMARSAAAVVQGFERFDRAVHFAGVIFNHLGSERHLDYLKEALSAHVHMPCVGGLLRNEKIAIPERHLGLMTMEDASLSDEDIRRLAEQVEAGLDLDALLENVPDIQARYLSSGLPGKIEPLPPGRSVRIGVARDNAFCFYYQDNLDLLEACGAELVPFSPIADGNLPGDLDGLYIGGGYPELHASKLSGNEGMKSDMAGVGRAGMPIYAECGGFMYLCRELTDFEGQSWPMCGLFPFTTRMSRRLRVLGYREITQEVSTPLGAPGTGIRGHEFHYSEISGSAQNTTTAYRVSARNHTRKDREGYLVGNILGSYIHLHFGSCPQAAENLVAACCKYKKERKTAE